MRERVVYLVSMAFRRRVVEDKLVAVAIDSKVCNVHTAVGDFVIVLGVLLRGYPDQTVVVEVNTQGVEARHQNVQPYVKLKRTGSRGEMHL